MFADEKKVQSSWVHGGMDRHPLQVVVSRSGRTRQLLGFPGPVEVNLDFLHGRQAFSNGVIDECQK